MSNNCLKNLVPCPRKAEKKDGLYVISEDSRVFVCDRTKKSYNFWLSKMNITKIEKNPLSDDLFVVIIGDENIEVPKISFTGEEAYKIVVNDDGIVIAANSEQGLSFGVRTLVKIYNMGKEIPALEIEDEPMVDMRAIHMCVFDTEDGSEKDDTSPEDLKRRIELAALLGYNHVFIEFWGMFPYERHPYAAWKHSNYSKEKIEEIVSFCIDDLHIIPCPGQNLTSHAGWSRITTRRHVVLDQNPDMADMYIPGGWCFATENPKTQSFLKDVIDELVEAFHNPPMFHICCDKAFGFGSTEEDRTKPADMLFAHHVCNLNTYLSSKGIKTVMWADMLYTSMDSLIFKCSPFVAEMLPKNILMDVWTHNDPGEYWHDIDFFEDKGYETVYSPFMNYQSIKNMVKLCIKKGSKGIVQTTWHRPEAAIPYFTYSASIQWNMDFEPDEEKINEFIKVYGKNR